MILAQLRRCTRARRVERDICEVRFGTQWSGVLCATEIDVEVFVLIRFGDTEDERHRIIGLTELLDLRRAAFCHAESHDLEDRDYDSPQQESFPFMVCDEPKYRK